MLLDLRLPDMGDLASETEGSATEGEAERPQRTEEKASVRTGGTIMTPAPSQEVRVRGSSEHSTDGSDPLIRMTRSIHRQDFCRPLRDEIPYPDFLHRPPPNLTPNRYLSCPNPVSEPDHAPRLLLGLTQLRAPSSLSKFRTLLLIRGARSPPDWSKARRCLRHYDYDHRSNRRVT